MSTQRERDQTKRDQKLRDIDDALDEGRLTIRPMTEDERVRFPPRERPEKPRRRPFRGR